MGCRLRLNSVLPAAQMLRAIGGLREEAGTSTTVEIMGDSAANLFGAQVSKVCSVMSMRWHWLPECQLLCIATIFDDVTVTLKPG